MNVFEAVRNSVTARQVAEHYGVKIVKGKMARCPFHNDRNPSLLLDSRFICFGCGEKGDAIDYVTKLFGIGKLDAARQIASDFSISYDKSGYKKTSTWKKKPVPKLTQEQRFQMMEKKCFLVLSDYLHLLKHWESKYAPQTKEQEWHPLFAEALQEKTKTEYRLDILLYAPLTERIALVTECGERILEIERRMEQYSRGTEEGSGTGYETHGTAESGCRQ